MVILNKLVVVVVVEFPNARDQSAFFAFHSFLVEVELDTSSETQGQIVGARESLNGRENMGRRKVNVLYFSSCHIFPPV